jgi:hypothetical protein
MSVRRFKTLELWIKEALSDDEKDGLCTALGLVYRKPEGGTKEIHTVKLTGKTWEPKNLADLFTGKAETFAQDLPGRQTFEILAFYGGRREAEAQHPFGVQDGEISAGGAGRSIKETPDNVGLTAQLMRHLERKDEALQGIIAGFSAVTLQMHQRTIEREEKMRDEVNEAYTIVREMIMDRKKADFDMEMAKLKYQRDSVNQERLMKQAPGLINVAAGREVFPQSTADTALMDALALRFTPEHVDAMVAMGMMTAEESGPLKLRIAQAHEQAKKLEDATKQLPPAHGEPLQ